MEYLLHSLQQPLLMPSPPSSFLQLLHLPEPVRGPPEHSGPAGGRDSKRFLKQESVGVGWKGGLVSLTHRSGCRDRDSAASGQREWPGALWAGDLPLASLGWAGRAERARAMGGGQARRFQRGRGPSFPLTSGGAAMFHEVSSCRPLLVARLPSLFRIFVGFKPPAVHGLRAGLF